MKSYFIMFLILNSVILFSILFLSYLSNLFHYYGIVPFVFCTFTFLLLFVFLANECYNNYSDDRNKNSHDYKIHHNNNNNNNNDNNNNDINNNKTIMIIIKITKIKKNNDNNSKILNQQYYFYQIFYRWRRVQVFTRI